MSPRKHLPLTTTILTPTVRLTLLLLTLLIVLLLLLFFPIPHPSSATPTHMLSGRRVLAEKTTEVEREFWRQPDGLGYRPCIKFSVEYRRESAVVAHERRRVVVPIVTGGLNQQRLQIVDAVVIARILGAALALPVLRPNLIWGDNSNFSEIFDEDHFRHTLRPDVHVLASLPDPPVGQSPAVEASMPFNVSPVWIRARFGKQLEKHRVLVLKGLDSKLSKDLPLDLQKLRCKVAFNALRFTAPIRELGDKLASRMWEGGRYIALHLRLEKDVWIRTGCLPGLGPEYDEVVIRERKAHPELLTGRLNLTHDYRRLSGLCPMKSLEVARLLRAMGAPKRARVYWAGGEPLGGKQALRELAAEFPNLITKETLALASELAPYANKSSILAAVDFIVAMSSDVFMPSHGGNMGRAMQGHRAFAGHLKYIKPNKRAVVQLLAEAAVKLSDAELSSELKRVHKGAIGQPEMRKAGGDVIAYPVPDCMCKRRFSSGVKNRWNPWKH